MTKPSHWQTWMRQPQRLRWRQLLVQVHLWIGLVLGLYVVLLSVTGSVSVLRADVHGWFVPRTVAVVGERLTGDALQDAVRRAYPEYEVASVFERRRPDTPVIATLRRDGAEVDRQFDPYAARDLGLAYPPTTAAIEWVVDLHDNLLSGPTGRQVNGVGALLFVALVFTGAIVWWPGTGRVGRAASPGRPAKSVRFARRLHSSLGIWVLALIVLWAITAVYLTFPEPFEWLRDRFDDDLSDGIRPAEDFVRTLVNLHFGRAWGMTVKLAYVVLGLVPAALFVTGFATWWIRVARSRGAAADSEPPTASGETPLAR